MTMLQKCVSFPTAVKLRDAGFPQTETEHIWEWLTDVKPDGTRVTEGRSLGLCAMRDSLILKRPQQDLAAKGYDSARAPDAMELMQDMHERGVRFDIRSELFDAHRGFVEAVAFMWLQSV